jgi:hypothetical protein
MKYYLQMNSPGDPKANTDSIIDIEEAWEEVAAAYAGPAMVKSQKKPATGR